MIIVLNGPLGIGKSTLAEALGESIDQCVSLDGDHLIAANPPQPDELGHLHATLRLLIAHHQRYGYRYFVVDHIWRSSHELDELRSHVSDLDPDIRVFLLTLPYELNLARIEQRSSVRAIDERDHDLLTVQEERAILQAAAREELGVPFDVSGSPSELVEDLLTRLNLPHSSHR